MRQSPPELQLTLDSAGEAAFAYSAWQRGLREVLIDIYSDRGDPTARSQRLLDEIGGRLDLQAGEIWSLDDEREALWCSHFWQAHDVNLSELAHVNRQIRFSRGQDVAGTAWQTAEPLYVADIGKQRALPRAPVLLRGGLRCAIAVPLRVGAVVHGAAAFYGRKAHAQRSAQAEFLSLFFSGRLPPAR
jgi:hypothetical protein